MSEPVKIGTNILAVGRGFLCLPLVMGWQFNINFMLKISEIKKMIQEADALVGKTFYDSRYAQFYKIKKRTKHNFILLYEKRGEKTEAVSFIIYHIQKKQHTLKK
jgi:hypothetical protein